MALQYRKSKSLGKGARLNMSKSGLSVSNRVGPLTFNSRGRASVRIAPGLSYRARGKNAGWVALIALAVMLAVAAIRAAIILFYYFAVVLWWVGRWAWFGAHALIERRRADRAPE